MAKDFKPHTPRMDLYKQLGGKPQIKPVDTGLQPMRPKYTKVYGGE
jgi:hypothetical protein